MAKDDNQDEQRKELFQQPQTKYDSAYIKNTIDLDKILAERRAQKENRVISGSQKPFIIKDNTAKQMPVAPATAQKRILTHPSQERSKVPKKETVAPTPESKIPPQPITKKEAVSPSKPKTLERENLQKSLENIVVGDMKIEEKIRRNKGSTAKITPVREFVQTSFEDTLGIPAPQSERKPSKFVISIPDDEESNFFKTDEDFSENKSVYENVTFDEHIKKLTPEDTVTDFEFPLDEEADEKTRTILGLLFQPDDEEDNPSAKVKKARKKANFVPAPKPPKVARSTVHIFDEIQDATQLKKELYHRVQTQKFIGFVVTFILALQFLAFYCSFTPFLLDFYNEYIPLFSLPKLSAILNILLFFVCYELLQKVILEIASFKLSYLTLSAILLLATVISDLFYSTEILFAFYPALLYSKQYFNMANQYRKARIDSKLVLSKSEKTFPLPLEENGLFADSFGNKIKASSYHRGKNSALYFTRAFSKNATEKLFSRLFILPFLIFAWLLFINSLAPVAISPRICFIFAMIAALPLNALFAFHSPYKVISKQLRRKSALIAGQDGIDDLFSMDEIAFSDEVLFASSKPLVAGIKLYGKSTFEEVVLTAASVAYYLQQPILNAFMHILDNKKEVLLSVDEAKYQDKSGVYAFLNGNVVVLGTEVFLKQNLIRLPKDNIGDKIRNHSQVPLYLAINGNLSAVFSIRYSVDKSTRKAVRQLIGAGIGILISTTDPLLNEELIEWLFDIKEDFVRIVPIKNRTDVAGDPNQEVPVSALISSKHLSAFIKTIASAFRLKNTILVNNIIVLLYCIFSTVIFTFLIYTSNIEILTPLIFLLYELVWTVPIWIITYITKNICK